MNDSPLQGRGSLRAVLERVRLIIEDGVVTDAEARDFYAWLERHPELYAVPPANLIILQLRRILADGRITEGERGDLLALLRSVTEED